jgi:hypothetical protein
MEQKPFMKHRQKVESEKSSKVAPLQTKFLQSCALKFRQLLIQDFGKTIHFAEKNHTSYKRAGFFTEMKKKKNSKWPPQKKTHFPAPPIFMVWSLGS